MNKEYISLIFLYCLRIKIFLIYWSKYMVKTNILKCHLFFKLKDTYVACIIYA